jgi:hypothetical protein
MGRTSLGRGRQKLWREKQIRSSPARTEGTHKRKIGAGRTKTRHRELRTSGLTGKPGAGQEAGPGAKHRQHGETRCPEFWCGNRDSGSALLARNDAFELEAGNLPHARAPATKTKVYSHTSIIYSYLLNLMHMHGVDYTRRHLTTEYPTCS